MNWTLVFIVNWLVNILMIEYLVIRKFKVIIDVNEARDSKYPAFRRTDIVWINRVWLYMTCHLSVIRVILPFASLLICGMMNKLIVIGLKPGEPITGLRYKLMRFWCAWSSYVVLFSAGGAAWVSVKRPKVCYKKYLGDDWVGDYDKSTCGCVVSNHTSFLDIAIHTIAQLPVFVSKVEVKSMPFLGMTMEICNCLFLDRKDAKDKKLI